LNEQLGRLAWCTSVEGFPDWAYWWDGSRLSSVPAECAEMIAPWIFDSSPHAVIALSATLAAEGAFDYWRRETGIIPGRTLVLDSPFPLREQMSLWVVDLGRPVTQDDYPDTVARVVEKLCEQNGGSTLVLLSSFRVLGAVAARLASVKRGFRVLVQGQAPRWELLREFREDESSVLVGSVSFREGIDVPGKGLSQVIIDRIPFPHPSDPLIQTLEEKYGRKLFHRILLPGAKLLLRQAAGRLIRSFGDSGRVAILDGRVLSRTDWNIPAELPDAPYRKVTIVESNNGDFQETGKAVAPK
ncbi:MAG: ATP-dependent DNA helicase, partial [Synergistota bacterium]|nr:ATP-dependent DNA helicase [Synergistota bacterium]